MHLARRVNSFSLELLRKVMFYKNFACREIGSPTTNCRSGKQNVNEKMKISKYFSY